MGISHRDILLAGTQQERYADENVSKYPVAGLSPSPISVSAPRNRNVCKKSGLAAHVGVGQLESVRRCGMEARQPPAFQIIQEGNTHRHRQTAAIAADRERYMEAGRGRCPARHARTRFSFRQCRESLKASLFANSAKRCECCYPVRPEHVASLSRVVVGASYVGRKCWNVGLPYLARHLCPLWCQCGCFDSQRVGAAVCSDKVSHECAWGERPLGCLDCTDLERLEAFPKRNAKPGGLATKMPSVIRQQHTSAVKAIAHPRGGANVVDHLKRKRAQEGL